jgi:hypothetical protein
MTRSILYQSRARTGFPSPVDHDILEEAWRHNGAHGVTGYLLRTKTQYFQVLEGDSEVLEPLLDRIARDDRHDAVEVLQDAEIGQRRFGKWAMGYHLLTEEERDGFDGWSQEGDAFSDCMIDYMKKMAHEREARSVMTPLRPGRV